jgi:hypothetical protein
MTTKNIKMFFAGALLGMLLAACAFNPPAAFRPPDISLGGERFIPEPVEKSGLIPSDVFWLADSELVSVKWESIILTASSGNWISSCDICGPSQIVQEDEGWVVHCNSLQGDRASIPNRPAVKVIERDLPIADTYRIRQKINYEDGCNNFSPAPTAFLPGGRTAYPNTFLADRDALYTLLLVIYEPSTVTEGELKGTPGEARLEVQVVREGMPKPVSPQTLEPSDGLTEVWEWHAGVQDGKWELNFSNRLRVTNVRILKGKRHAATNRFFPTDPMNPYVVPYRIEFASHSCYANRDVYDGDIDLRRCRQSPNDQNGAAIIATPTYLNTTDQTPLTWRVVFNSAEGFPAPNLVGDEELAIEFTLEVRP